MNCDCTEKISALIDGELSSGDARELEQHLLTCVECREAQADFRNLRTQMTNFPVSFQPVAQREALARILGTEKTASAGLGWRWVFNPAVAAFASLLIVGVVFALLVYPRLKSSPSTPSDTALNNGEKRNNPRATSSPSPARVPRQLVQRMRHQRSRSHRQVARRASLPSRSRHLFLYLSQTTSQRFGKAVGTIRSADAETMTAIHLQKSESLLRSFRNVRMTRPGAVVEVGYEKKRAQQLVYQNMMLRREADAAGDAQVASLLESLEPILLDIANLPDKPRQDDVRVIKDRVERKNIVALLQINSTALARALD